MEHITFKQYCLMELQKLEQQLINTRYSLKKLPPKENISLPNDEELTHLQEQVKKSTKSLRFILFGISEKDLKKYYRQQEKDRLTKEISRLQDSINELKQITSLDDNEELKILSKHQNIILAIFNYSLNYHLDIHETLLLLLYIFKTEKTNKESSISKLEEEIISLFNKDGSIEKSNLNTVLTLFKKILEEFNLDNNPPYKELIQNIYEELKRCTDPTYINSVERAALLNKKAAIIKLKKYISNNQVIAPSSSLNEFTHLLKKAGYSKEDILKYQELMTTLIKQKNQERNDSLALKHLSQEEYKLYLEAQKIIADPKENTNTSLITCLLNNIISLCIYLDTCSDYEYQDSKEILFTQLLLLKEQIKMSKNPLNEPSTYRYVLDNNYPRIMSQIEKIDQLLYPEILNQLFELSENNNYPIAYTNSGINFYFAQSNHFTIIFTYLKDKKVLVGLSLHTSYEYLIEEISSTVINTIKQMQEKDQEENILLEQNYENFLIKLLDLDGSTKSKTLKK